MAFAPYVHFNLNVMNPMTPNLKEKEISKLASLLVYVKKRIGLTISKQDLTILADPYPNKEDKLYVENELTHLLEKMDTHTYQAIITGGEYQARQLKDWWEKHEKVQKAIKQPSKIM